MSNSETQFIIGKIINVKLAFKKVDKKSFLSKMIGLWTKSKYSHVEIIIGNLWVSSVEFKGVHVKPLLPLKDTWDYVDLGDIEFSVDHYNNIMSWIYSQEDKKYDWVGIFLSQILPLRIQDNNKWFCSEFVVRILQMMGNDLEIQDYQANLVSPGKLAKIYKLE
jgi:hypothetical protein